MPAKILKSDSEVPAGCWYLQRLGEGDPMVITLQDNCTVIGSSNMLRGGKRVSPEHAVLKILSEHNLVILFDNRSNYGTYVNSKKVPIEGRILKVNDALSLGRKWPRSSKHYGFTVRCKENNVKPANFTRRGFTSDCQTEDSDGSSSDARSSCSNASSGVEWGDSQTEDSDCSSSDTSSSSSASSSVKKSVSSLTMAEELVMMEAFLTSTTKKKGSRCAEKPTKEEERKKLKLGEPHRVSLDLPKVVSRENLVGVDPGCTRSSVGSVPTRSQGEDKRLLQRKTTGTTDFSIDRLLRVDPSCSRRFVGSVQTRTPGEEKRDLKRKGTEARQTPVSGKPERSVENVSSSCSSFGSTGQRKSSAAARPSSKIIPLGYQQVLKPYNLSRSSSAIMKKSKVAKHRSIREKVRAIYGNRLPIPGGGSDRKMCL